MKKFLFFITVACIMAACNNAAETKVPEDPTFEQVTVDTLPAGMDSSAAKTDTSKMDKVIKD